MNAEYHDWLIKTSHADLYMAWQAGEENVKAKVIRMLQPCLERDSTIQIVIDAVAEL